MKTTTCESVGEERDLEKKKLETLQHATTVGEKFDEMLQGLRQHFSPSKPAVIVISEFEVEEHMEKGAIEKGIKQPIEVEQPTYFSSKPIKKQYFDIDISSPNVPIVVPTKA